MNNADDLWTNAPIISRYTRAQAIEDGVLIDVSAVAKQAGFSVPVAITAALWADVQDIPLRYQGYQDVKGRLWDVLWMAVHAIRLAQGGGSELCYRLIMHNGQTTYYRVKLVSGPGDSAEHVITLMKPDES